MKLSKSDRDALIYAIASKEGTAKELAWKYGHTVEDLREFVNDYQHYIEEVRYEIEQAQQIAANIDKIDQLGQVETGIDLGKIDDLWISSKYKRLKRYQQVVDQLMASKYMDATTLREIRSYMHYAAEELGQLLNRGAGQSADSESTVKYSIDGIDPEDLR
jgi:hypothetical protein